MNCARVLCWNNCVCVKECVCGGWEGVGLSGGGVWMHALVRKREKRVIYINKRQNWWERGSTPLERNASTSHQERKWRVYGSPDTGHLWLAADMETTDLSEWTAWYTVSSEHTGSQTHRQTRLQTENSAFLILMLLLWTISILFSSFIST